MTLKTCNLSFISSEENYETTSQRYEVVNETEDQNKTEN